MSSWRNAAGWVVAACACFIGCAGPAVASKEPAARSIRVLTYNIRHGVGMDGVLDLERIAQVIEAQDPDVVLLQEVDQGCARSGRVDQAQVLGRRLGMESRFCAFRPFDGGQYGMAALCRLPVISAKCLPLPPGPNPLRFLELRVDLDGEPVTVSGLHLVMTELQRLAQAEHLLARYQQKNEPVILAGDLNSEFGDPVLDRFLTAFSVPDKLGDALTFPADAPVKEIDFVLLAPASAWRLSEHRVVEEPLASDHRPVLLEARLAADRAEGSVSRTGTISGA